MYTPVFACEINMLKCHCWDEMVATVFQMTCLLFVDSLGWQISSELSELQRVQISFSAAQGSALGIYYAPGLLLLSRSASWIGKQFRSFINDTDQSEVENTGGCDITKLWHAKEVNKLWLICVLLKPTHSVPAEETGMLEACVSQGGDEVRGPRPCLRDIG